MRKPSYTSGFTLLEMSIVLVIIGLIVAALLVGQSLLRSSRLNSAVIDVQRYIAATQQFQKQYGALPGDNPDILAFPQPVTAATCDGQTPNTLPNQTCAGNGDGVIEHTGTVVYTTTGNYTTTESEDLLFWQHLSITGYIQGSFTGVGASGSVNNIHLPGTNCPITRVGGGYSIAYVGLINASYHSTLSYYTKDFFDGTYNHVIFMGSYDNTNPDLTDRSLISGSEAQALDLKFDDGLPATGNIFTAKNGSTFWSYSSSTGSTTSVCATTNVSATAAYNVSQSGNICALGFITGF